MIEYQAEHPTGDVAFSGLEQDYESARPGYPKASLDYIFNLCPTPTPPLVVDVGCGTGKLTRQLADGYVEARITGCDANDDMIAQARASTEGNQINYTVSSAESLPFSENEVGLMTVAQAVQWFDRPIFFREAKKVLASKGILVLIENNRDWRSSDFLDAYENLLEENAPGYSRFYRDHDYASELTEADYTDMGISRVKWMREMSLGKFIQMAKSSTRLQSALRAKGQSVISDLEQLLSKHATANSFIEVPYTTHIWTAVA